MLHATRDRGDVSDFQSTASTAFRIEAKPAETLPRDDENLVHLVSETLAG
jgi:hypothetical protein